MHRRRIYLWFLLETIMLIFILAWDDAVSNATIAARVWPAILIGVMYLLVGMVLIVRTPSRLDGVPWWQIWRLYDPFTAVMIVASICSVSAYQFALALGLGGIFTLPDFVYDRIRNVSLVVGFFGVPILFELLIEGVRARRNRRIRPQPIYTQEGEDDDGREDDLV